MPKEYSRAERLGEQLQRELAQLIQFELNDPRLASMITLNGVKVAKDLAVAKVYVTVLGDDEHVALALEGLRSAAGCLRRELGGRLTLRSTPKLVFVYDESVRRGERLSKLIDDVMAKERDISTEGRGE